MTLYPSVCAAVQSVFALSQRRQAAVNGDNVAITGVGVGQASSDIDDDRTAVGPDDDIEENWEDLYSVPLLDLASDTELPTVTEVLQSLGNQSRTQQ